MEFTAPQSPPRIVTPWSPHLSRFGIDRRLAEAGAVGLARRRLGASARRGRVADRGEEGLNRVGQRDAVDQLRLRPARVAVGELRPRGPVRSDLLRPAQGVY